VITARVASVKALTDEDIAAGLRRLGLTEESSVVVHASLRSFGRVEGGAAAVVSALTTVCGTVTMMAGSGDLTSVPAPPGLVRPHNAFGNAESWEAFDEAVEAATPYRLDLPVSRWLGVVAEALRTSPGAVRGPHPLNSFVAIGDRAAELIAGERLDLPHGALHRLAEIGGDVLLLGVGHAANTTIHLAEHRLGRGRFYRYARHGSGLWVELPNLGGASHRFDEIEPYLRPMTTETMIGPCRARRIAMGDVLEVATEVIRGDPLALLCDDDLCRCAASAAQILGHQ
jgi:aminoglycoside 3-N-acetyltransferase